MVKLKCENCGGTLERDKSLVAVTESTVIIRSGCDFVCQYCKSEFAAGTEHPRVGGAQIAIGSNIAQASGGGIAVVAKSGGVAIGGSVKGDIIVGGR